MNAKQIAKALEGCDWSNVSPGDKAIIQAAIDELNTEDYFAALVCAARIAATKAMKKFPQPNYVLLKVAEEAGEVVQAGVHYAEKWMPWENVEEEIIQLLAMLIRIVKEGDLINGVVPPEGVRDEN